MGSPREVELFFSRRIGIGDNGVQQPIDGGVRLSGKVAGSTNVGLLHMQTQAINELASDAFSVARVSQELANRSSIGAIFVRRQGEEDADYNNTYAIDGRWGIGDELTISAYLAKQKHRDAVATIRRDVSVLTTLPSLGPPVVGTPRLARTLIRKSAF